MVLEFQGEVEEGLQSGDEGESFLEANEQPIIAEDDAPPEPMNLQSQRMVETISDCFEEYCFGTGSFDLNKFVALSQTIFDCDNGRNDESSDSIEKVKSSIISRLIRKMFVTLSLTKTQMNLLNRFIKGVLVFSIKTTPKLRVKFTLVTIHVFVRVSTRLV